MQAAAFKVVCPYEIGDEIITENSGIQVITDIVTIHSLKTGRAEFQYELNNSGQYVKFRRSENE